MKTISEFNGVEKSYFRKIWETMLSADFYFVRIDLYNIADKIYLSEVAFIPVRELIKLE